MKKNMNIKVYNYISAKHINQECTNKKAKRELNRIFEELSYIKFNKYLQESFNDK